MTEMLHIAQKLNWRHFFSLRLSKTGLVSSDEIERFIKELIGDKEFIDLERPFVVSATDIKTGELMELKKGSVAKAVRISCSFPWMYTPVRHEGRMLVDGCLKANLPVHPMKAMGADVIIAVDVIPRVAMEVEPKNIVEVFDRSLDLLFITQSEKAAKDADYVIYPIQKPVTSLELNRGKELVEMGEEAAKEVIPFIKSKLL
ncbi:MAG: patatin-like phospholipase family protein [bacterium]